MSYEVFLELCGYEKDEVKAQEKRIERAIEKLRFRPDDFERAEQRMREYFDVDLISMRKMLGLWFRSLIDVVLAREEGKKLVYTMMPPLVLLQNAMTMASTELYVTAPDILLSYTARSNFWQTCSNNEGRGEGFASIGVSLLWGYQSQSGRYL